MRKTAVMALCLVLGLSLTGCGTAPGETGTPETPARSDSVSAAAETQRTDGETDADTIVPGLPDEQEEPSADGAAERGVPVCGVKMLVAGGLCSDGKTTFVLQNDSDREYTYGPEYALEEWAEGEWREIVPDPPLTWNAVEMRLAPQSSKAFEVDWSLGYGALRDGAYRLKKTVRDDAGNRSMITAAFDVPAICGGDPPAPEGFTKP